ncbi:MAG: phosphohydrolase, partial [Bacillota bacterium]
MVKEKSVFYEELTQIGLQELQESMSRALGLAVVVAYPDGRLLTKPSNLSSFCAMLDSNPEAQARCAASREVSARTTVAAGEEVFHTCHAGLVHLAVPLQVAGETVA